MYKDIEKETLNNTFSFAQQVKQIDIPYLSYVDINSERKKKKKDLNTMYRFSQLNIYILSPLTVVYEMKYLMVANELCDDRAIIYIVYIL